MSAASKGYLITGASRGLGRALAAQALQGARVVCVARQEPEGLRAMAERGPGEYEFVGLDLSETDTVLAQVDRLWQYFAGRIWDGLYLINNAATNQPVGRAERGSAVELVRAVDLNLTAVMLLTNSFIRVTDGWARDRRVLNIS